MATLLEQIENFFGGNDTNTDEGLRDLFISELKSVYYTEKQITRALGEQAEASTTDEVRQAFLQHQEESRLQQERIEAIFKIIGIKTEERTADAVDGLIEDAKRMIADTETGSLTRDAGLIISAQKVEHYEIAIYGSLLTLANVLDFTQSAELLSLSLEEEKATDRKLTVLAESFINSRSKAEEDANPGSHHESRHTGHAPDATLGGPLGV